MVKRKLKKSLIEIQSYPCSRECGKGEIILLYGTSSAGKSTICQEISKFCPQWRINSLDQASKLYIAKVIHDLFPYEKDVILKTFTQSDIYSIIFYGESDFRDGASIVDQKKAVKARLKIKQNKQLVFKNCNIDVIEKEMFENAVQDAKAGQSTVIDTVDFLQFFSYLKYHSFNCPVRYGLVYCPFSKLRERISRRNQNLKLVERRYGVHPFFQFSEFYENTRDNNNFVERIYRKDVIEAYRQTFIEYITNLPQKKTFDTYVTSLNDEKKLLKKLGFDCESTFYVNIKPRFYHDYFLNTYEKTPQECANLIIQGV